MDGRLLLDLNSVDRRDAAAGDENRSESCRGIIRAYSCRPSWAERSNGGCERITSIIGWTPKELEEDCGNKTENVTGFHWGCKGGTREDASVFSNALRLQCQRAA